MRRGAGRGWGGDSGAQNGLGFLLAVLLRDVHELRGKQTGQDHAPRGRQFRVIAAGRLRVHVRGARHGRKRTSN